MTGLPPWSAPCGSEDGTSERPLAQPPRYKSACESCHSSKVRCTGNQPCARCSSNGWECIYKLASRIGKPKGSRNKSTLRRLQLEAEQADCTTTRKSGSTTSTGSSPLPPTPITACTMPDSLGIANPVDPKAPLLTGSSYPGWAWPSDAELWMQTTDAEASMQSALDLAGVGVLDSPEESLFMFEGAMTSYGALGSSAESMQTAALHPNRRASGNRENRFSQALGSGNTLRPEDAYNFPQWSSSMPMDSHSAGTSSPANTWLIPDLTPGFEYGDPHWTPEPCACIRNLSWQLGRIDQLRQTLTADTTLRAFMDDTNDTIQAISDFLGCQICEKDSTGLSLMVTVFTNINHLFSMTLNHPMDTLALRIRDRNYIVGAVDLERLSPEEAIARGRIRHWLHVCEQGLRVVRNLTARASRSEATTPKAKQPDAAGAGRVALWGLPELSSFRDMLLRVKQNLGTLV